MVKKRASLGSGSNPTPKKSRTMDEYAVASDGKAFMPEVQECVKLMNDWLSPA